MGRRAFRCLAVAALAVASACAPTVAPPGAAGSGATTRPPTPTASVAAPPSPLSPASTVTAPGASRPVPPGKLRLADARRRMLALLNRDRASQGLSPLTLDEGAAQRAGQRHAEDMARHSFLGHWGTDGSNPEQRHTEAGGVDMVLENASCVDDLKPRELEAEPLVDEAAIAHAEHLFFDEVPPNDGHRRNILKPHHTRVGIGIALPVTTATEIGVPCFTQEMIDGYGTYAPVPTTARVGQTVRVEGTVVAPAVFGGVGIARVEAPRPQSPAEANKRRVYPVPTPFQVYWPRGFVTPIPVEVSGATFRVDVPLDDQGRPGLYEISVFGKLPGTKSHGMLGIRTIDVR